MSLGFKSQSVGVRANLCDDRTVDIWSMYSRTLLDILFLIWGQTVADYKMLSFHLSINVIIIVVSFKILDLSPIVFFNNCKTPCTFANFLSFRLNKHNPRDSFTDQKLDKFRRFWYKIYHHNPIGKYFNIELKWKVAQHENLSAKGIFGVRAPLRFFFSLCLNKYKPAIFL